ncbi:MAG: hypothetical protein N2449_06275 [Bacteroidales bacterium]|nr:hypothetical protein [Bacteroidales bacterium]
MNNKKIKLFIIAAYYPPIISVASQRIHALAKYIDKSLYEVYVLVPSNDKVNSDIEGVNVISIKAKSIIQYAKFDKNTSYLIHKLKALWNRILINFSISHYRNYEKPILKIIEKFVDNNPFVVITSSPPIEMLHIGISLRKKYNQCRWIADLRDALSNNPYIPKSQRHKHLLVEDSVLNNADAIVSVSMPIVGNLRAKSNRDIPIVEIRNGFDFEARLSFNFNNQFTIVHAGTFYANRTPETVFCAFENLLKKQQIDDFKLILVGQTSAITIPDTIKPYVQRIDKVPYTEVVKLLRIADALLLIHPPSDYKGVFTAKLFDYLGAMKPIIAAIDTNDVAAQLIKDCQAGFIANFYSIEEIEQAILSAYTLWKNKQTLNFNTSLIYLHHRAYQVKLYEQLIYKVLYEN